MKTLRIGTALGLGAMMVSSLLGTTATSLSSFEGIEEPLVRYTPATKTFRHDDYVNIVDLGGGTMRMTVRYRSDEWDADRDTHNTDRQRAEVKGLGPHQKNGETFEYETTWRTNPTFQGSGRFCHLFQLKSTNGDSGAPLVTLSIMAGQQRAAVHYWAGPMKTSVPVREFDWKPGVWQTVRIRIKTSTTNDGEVLASVNGDEFQGMHGIAVYRTGATDYRPKWGLYRGVTTGLPIGDDYVEHKGISAEKTGTTLSSASAAEIQKHVHELAADSPEKAVKWLESQPRSPTRSSEFAELAADWALRDPSAAIKFALQLSAADGRAMAVQRVFNRWADRDPDAVLRWAKTQPSSNDLDDLLWYYSTDTTFRYVSRERALDGASLIADSELRARALEHVILIWARTEPTPAAQYLQSVSVLTADQKAEIRGKFKPQASAF